MSAANDPRRAPIDRLAASHSRPIAQRGGSGDASEQTPMAGEEELRLAQLFEETLDCVLLLTSELDVLQANASARRAFGERIVGRSASSITTSETRRRIWSEGIPAVGVGRPGAARWRRSRRKVARCPCLRCCSPIGTVSAAARASRRRSATSAGGSRSRSSSPVRHAGTHSRACPIVSPSWSCWPRRSRRAASPDPWPSCSSTSTTSRCQRRSGARRRRRAAGRGGPTPRVRPSPARCARPLRR